MAKTSAKVPGEQRSAKKNNFPLDTVSGKPRRGRKPKIPAPWIRGRADNYRRIFDQLWKHIWPRLARAKTRQDVVLSFSGSDVGGYAVEFVTLADLILQVVRDPKFPKRKREA